MAFHQVGNTLGDVYNAFVYSEAHWDTHLHKAFELIIHQTGTCTVEVDKRRYCLGAGEGVLVPPFVSHSIEMEKGNRCLVLVFSGQNVGAASRLFEQKSPVEYRLTLEGGALAYVWQGLAGKRKTDGEKSAIPNAEEMEKPAPFLLKACLYAVMAEFFRQNPLLVKKERSERLAEEILSYVEGHYRENISVGSLAAALGYSYDYVSKSLNRTFGVNFNRLCNQYRCERALQLIRETDMPVTEVALECGFQSIRSFNRACLEAFGTAPRRLR